MKKLYNTIISAYIASGILAFGYSMSNQSDIYFDGFSQKYFTKGAEQKAYISVLCAIGNPLYWSYIAFSKDSK